MTNEDRTAVALPEDTSSAEMVRERNIARLELAGFTRQQAERLNFIVWLDTKRDLEYRVREG